MVNIGRRLSVEERRRRNVVVRRQVLVGTNDLSAHHLAAAWLERQLRKDIRLLQTGVAITAPYPVCEIVCRLRLRVGLSLSFVECWGEIE